MWLGDIDRKLQTVPGGNAKVIMGCRAHLCHLPGLGQVGHSSREISGSAGTLDWGPVMLGSLSSCHQPTDQSLTGWYFIIWLVGFPIAAGKLAGWLTAYWTEWQPDCPQVETSCGHLCDYFGHKDLWSDVPPVETSHGQVWYYYKQADLWSVYPPIWDFRPGCHLVRFQVRSSSCQMYPPPLKKSSGHGKMIDPLDDFYSTKAILPGRVTI